jgi:Flp pilus assembly protein TadG
MFGTSITRRIRETAKRFIGANEGNIAVLFTLAAIPIISFVGAAIDYSRANSARSTMQAAMDSTALMLSKDLSSGKIASDPTTVSRTAQAYFTALYTNKDATIAPITATYTANNASLGNTILISGTGTINTDFMRVLGSNFNTMGFGTTSTTAWGNVKMRVALVLDNTGSMAQNGKITALRNAVAGTGGLIDQLSALAKNNGDVYISVIPFAKVVNPGSSNYSASWIDWTDWLNPPTAQPNNALSGTTNYQAALPMNWHAVGPGSVCPFTNSSGGFVCTTGPANGSATATTSGRNVIPSSGTYNGYICPSVDYNSHTLYNGCWDSVATTPASGVFCSGNSNCACPTNSSGNTISGCSCTGSGTGKSCTGLTYTHHWTQPGVVAPVGFTNNTWTSTNSTPTVANVWTAASTNPTTTWTGCITDRTQSYDETGDTPSSGTPATLFPANQYYENSTAYCNANASTPLEQIIPMSYSWSTLKTAVNAMQPTGGTDQSVGLAWGWQSLLQTGPIPAPTEDANTTYNRVIILLSDGLNTEDRWPAYGDGSTQNTNSSGAGYIDVRQAAQCQNIKNATDSNGKPMYTIYTIQVNTSSPADPTSTVLRNCASDLSKFFMLTSSTQIATTFNTIGTALSQLRVAR